MITVNDVFAFLNTVAPIDLQMDFDNSGFLIGDGTSAVTSVLIALDITDQVVDEAWSKNVQLIISHHPVIFHPMKNQNMSDKNHFLNKLIFFVF